MTETEMKSGAAPVALDTGSLAVLASLTESVRNAYEAVDNQARAFDSVRNTYSERDDEVMAGFEKVEYFLARAAYHLQTLRPLFGGTIPLELLAVAPVEEPGAPLTDPEEAEEEPAPAPVAKAEGYKPKYPNGSWVHYIGGRENTIQNVIWQIVSSFEGSKGAYDYEFLYEIKSGSLGLKHVKEHELIAVSTSLQEVTE